MYLLIHFSFILSFLTHFSFFHDIYSFIASRIDLLFVFLLILHVYLINYLLSYLYKHVPMINLKIVYFASQIFNSLIMNQRINSLLINLLGEGFDQLAGEWESIGNPGT